MRERFDYLLELLSFQSSRRAPSKILAAGGVPPPTESGGMHRIGGGIHRIGGEGGYTESGGDAESGGGMHRIEGGCTNLGRHRIRIQNCRQV